MTKGASIPEKSTDHVNGSAVAGLTARTVRKQVGVGLIEILIAVVLMSIGFLAAARMQVEGMRFSQSAYYQSQAYFLANDMIDRMRSNITGVQDGFYTGVETAANAYNPGCELSMCNAQSIARQDIFEWSANLHPLYGTSGFVSALPGSETTTASGQIVDMGDNIFAVVMNWNEVIGGADSTQTLRIQFALEN